MKKIVSIICVIILSSSMIGASALHESDSKDILKICSSSNDGTEYWALIVGCNEFINRPELNLPGNDISAKDLRDTLLKSDNWRSDHIRVLTGENATSLNIIRGLRWLDKMDDDDDVCLFYIATHAGPLNFDFPPFDEEDGDECLTTYSTHRFFDIENRVSYVIPWISYLYDDEINLLLSKLDSLGICAIFNTCYAEGFDDPASNSVNNEKFSSVKWMEDFAEELRSSGRVVLMACEEDSLSLGPIFSYYIMEGLQGFGDKNDDEIVTAEEAFEYAAPKTNIYCNREFYFPQTPVIFDDYDNELILTNNELPPDNPILKGPISGESNTEHIFSIFSNDPKEDRIRYYINWGDDTETWTNTYPSGETVNLTHSWNEVGTYNIWFENEDEKGVGRYEQSLIKRKVVTITDNNLIDQYQTLTYQDQCFNDGLITQTAWVAQSFIPTQPVLSKVDLEAMILLIYSEQSGPLRVSIRSDLYGSDLTETSAMPMQINDNMLPFVPKFKWTTFDFPDIEVIPGNKYYIVCRFDYNSIGGWTYAGLNYEDDPEYQDDPYPNGEPYFSINNGQTWNIHSKINDFCFVTYGE